VGRPRPGITVVGLGPAGSDYISAAVAAQLRGGHAYLRTARHPAAEEFSHLPSLDSLYESADTFEEVYAAVVEALVAAAIEAAPEPVVYAVPGSPLIAERTVELLRVDERADVTVIPALSFLDLAWERLGIDPVTEGVRLVDAEQFSVHGAHGHHGAHAPLLVAQCWTTTLLSDIKLSAQHEEGLPDVVLLHHLGLPDEQVRTVGWWEMDRTLAPDHLTSLFIPAPASARAPAPASTEHEMARLVELVATLRLECPWDRKQTHATLMPHLLEESYEVLDALGEMESPDAEQAPQHLEEELGDLLFQIVFHARLAEEHGQFTLADVAQGVHDKLVHRHPHVFGDVVADSADQVVTNWEAIKKQEKGRTSVTEGIPMHLPALLLSTKLQRKAISVGMPDPVHSADATPLGQLLKATEGAADARAETGSDDTLDGENPALTHQVGELLFGVANLARRLSIDPEQALRGRALRYTAQIQATEAAAVPKTPEGTK
jgi:tetrapyrrole methylase family protein / MazG family protein